MITAEFLAQAIFFSATFALLISFVRFYAFSESLLGKRRRIDETDVSIGLDPLLANWKVELAELEDINTTLNRIFACGIQSLQLELDHLGPRMQSSTSRLMKLFDGSVKKLGQMGLLLKSEERLYFEMQDIAKYKIQVKSTMVLFIVAYLLEILFAQGTSWDAGLLLLIYLGFIYYILRATSKKIAGLSAMIEKMLEDGKGREARLDEAIKKALEIQADLNKKIALLSANQRISL